MNNTELKEINAARKVVGLPPLRPGPTKCLRCLREFDSWGVANNRICPSCSRLSDTNGMVGVELLTDVCTDVEVANSLTEIELWRSNPRSRHHKEIYRQGRQIVDLEEDHLHLFDPDDDCVYEEEEDECLD